MLRELPRGVFLYAHGGVSDVDPGVFLQGLPGPSGLLGPPGTAGDPGDRVSSSSRPSQLTGLCVCVCVCLHAINYVVERERNRGSERCKERNKERESCKARGREKEGELKREMKRVKTVVKEI